MSTALAPSDCSIEIHQSARGTFWSQIVLTETLKAKVLWHLVENAKTRAEALEMAESRLAALTESCS